MRKGWPLVVREELDSKRWFEYALLLVSPTEVQVYMTGRCWSVTRQSIRVYRLSPICDLHFTGVLRAHGHLLSKLLIVCNLFASWIYLKYCSNNNQRIKQYLENLRFQKLQKMWLENITCCLNGTAYWYLSFESLYFYRWWYILISNVAYNQLQKSLSYHVVLKETNL